MRTTSLLISFMILISKIAFAGDYFQGASIQNLTIDCDGVLSIEKVGNIYFSPQLPPNGRFDGRPASGSIQIFFKISEFNKVGCQLLHSKYKFNSSKLLQGYANVTNPIDKADVESHAEFIKKYISSNQAKVYFKLDQAFDNIYGEDYLPFFPDIVKESLSLNGTLNSGQKYIIPLNINIANVYKTTPVIEWTDEKKLALASKALQLVKFSYGPENKFDSYILSHKFESDEFKQKYLGLLWQGLKKAQADGAYLLFKPWVGGSGGNSWFRALNTVLNEVGTDQQKKLLIYSFPSLLIPSWAPQVCPILSEGELLEIGQLWTENVNAFTVNEKSTMIEVLKLIIANNSFPYSCVGPLMSEANTKTLTKLLGLLK